MNTEYQDFPEQPIKYSTHLGTPEEVTAARAKMVAKMDYEINEGPQGSILRQAATTLHDFENHREEESAEILRSHAVDLINTIEAFKRGQICELLPMLTTQATVLNSLFNRSLQNAGLEDKDSF